MSGIITYTRIIAARKLGLLFRPCLEYGSHLWRGAPKHSLASLDAIQKRLIKLIGNSALTNSPDSLAHRRTISALSLYYRYYRGVCSVELKLNIPPKAVFTRNKRFSNAQHPSLPPPFPTTYKPSKPECTDIYSSTLSLDQILLLFCNARVFREPFSSYGAPLLNSISLKKKKNVLNLV